jgi:hypothetical protein
MPAFCHQDDCGWETGEPNRDIAGCLAAWHVYEDHPDVWLRVIGDRPPADPDPRTPEGRAVLAVMTGSS